MSGRLRTAYAGPDDSPGFLLWRVTNAWQAAQRAALAPHDLTHVQFVLLATLAWLGADEVVTQARLAARAGTDPMMTSQVVRALEAKALLHRTPHPSDARARAVALTERGARVADAATAVVEDVDRAFFGRLGAPDREHLVRSLRDLGGGPDGTGGASEVHVAAQVHAQTEGVEHRRLGP